MTVDEHYPWHAEAWQRLVTARLAGRLPHALLLTGPAGLGKAAFARRLSNALMCPQPDEAGDACGTCRACHLSSAGSHPDQSWVGPEEPGKLIKIDAIRQLIAGGALAAQDAGYRVFVLDPAEAMNRPAANALLKTLEEPASCSLLVLVSSHPDRLPATVRSRCHGVRFAIPEEQLVRDWLSRHTAPADIDELLAVSGGAPLTALRARDEAWLEEGRCLHAELAALAARRSDPVEIVEKWEARPLTLVFDSLKRCLCDLIRLGSGAIEDTIYFPALRADLQSLGRGLELNSLYRLYDAVLGLERDAERNLNEKMMLEHLVNQWLQITRLGGR